MARLFTGLDEEERRTVWSALNAGSYYLFTGSGVSLDSQGVEGNMLSAGELNERLRKLTDLGPTSTLQQNYSLLSPEEIKSNITIPYTCLKPGNTIEALARIPWRRVYTLNVDNAFEYASRSLARAANLPSEVIASFNYNELFHELSPDHIQSVVHLHGNVEKSETSYVFSHNEYARHMNRPNSWMMTLTQLMKSEPFIVAGTSLDEIDVEFYLQQHAGIDRSDRQRAVSILVEPYPSRLTRKICTDHGLVLFEGKALDLINALRSEFTDFSNPFSEFGPQTEYGYGHDPQTVVLFESSFEKVKPSAEPSQEGARFLLGAPLTWNLIASGVDVDRSVVRQVEREIGENLKSEAQGLVYLADPGSGKSSLLRKVAFRAAQKYRNVFYYSGVERLDEATVANIISRVQGDVLIFVDNVADSASYIVGIMDALDKRSVCFVCIERSYRYPYLADAFAEHDVTVKRLDLDLARSEASKLLAKNEEFGLSDVSQRSDFDRQMALAEVVKNPIAIANCRIQNNFLAFDQIVRSMLAGCPPEELKFFILAALARHAYAGGVSKAVLHAIPGRASFTEVDNIYSRLPVVGAPDAPGYVIPARAAVSERVLEVIKTSNPKLVVECLIELCRQLAPRVNRDTIRRRTPEAKLTGGLMDFDRTIQRFINDYAEEFYGSIAAEWDWNSRYWEQLALMKLSRFLENRDDPFLLQEAIQNARFAYSIDEHPLSLTTLAKTLFAALDAEAGDKDVIFAEGWRLIYSAIEIEKSWTRIKPTAFIVAFKGVRSFAERGGQLTGDQANEVREAISITHQRKLRDKKLFELRDEVKALV